MRLVVLSLGLLPSDGVCVLVHSRGLFGFPDWHVQPVFWGSPCSSHSKAKKPESSLARALPTYSLKEHPRAQIRNKQDDQEGEEKKHATCVTHQHQHTCARPSKPVHAYASPSEPLLLRCAVHFEVDPPVLAGETPAPSLSF